jgi:hypothetical protein
VRAALLLVLLVQTPPEAVPPGPGPEPAPPTTALPAPLPPPPSASAILRSAAALEPSQRVPLAPGAEVVVDPSSTFEVELSARVPDARLALADARDDLVPASGTRELAQGTRLTLAPAAPLVPGSRYALRVDGAAARDLHDEAGRAFAPLSLPILVAGTPPPPEPPKPARQRKRRR